MSDELDAYKRRIIGVYDRAAVAFGESGPPLFRHAGRRLVEVAGVPEGARVLDVATGRGAVLLAAAERVGPTGTVLGVDLSEEMVRETSAEVVRLQLPGVEVRVMDAEKLDIPDSTFDYVFCSFAIFFFAHLERVLARFRQVVRPGGMVGIALADEPDPRWEWVNDLFRSYVVFDPTPQKIRGIEVRQPGVLKRLLDEAGFVDVEEVIEETELELGSQEDWLASLWAHGTRRLMESMTPERLAAFETEAKAHLGEIERTGKLTEVFSFRYTIARRPNGG